MPDPTPSKVIGSYYRWPFDSWEDTGEKFGFDVVKYRPMPMCPYPEGDIIETKIETKEEAEKIAAVLNRHCLNYTPEEAREFLRKYKEVIGQASAYPR